MNKKYKSSFSSCVKLRPSQLTWLKNNKDCKTVAGFLDKILNRYKKEQELQKIISSKDKVEVFN